MDPATAAGLALGIFPLLISILENYHSILRPIKILSKDYSKEVLRFRKQLRVAHTNFQSECEWLLKSLDVSSETGPMIRNTQHSGWNDAQLLDGHLRARLNDTYDACVAALSLIADLLADIGARTKDLDLLLEPVSSQF